MSKIKHIDHLDLNQFERGKLHRVWFDLIDDPLGEPMSIPLLIGRGRKEGPVFGLTAALHGNELNGIPVIQRFFKEIEKETIAGTVIGVPVVNIPSFLRKKRRFTDGVDLNHIMPGKEGGNVSQNYAYRFFHGIAKQFNYLIDLHTASAGRINSYYIRADMDDKITRDLAMLQNAQIIVNNPPSDGTLRGAAGELEISAITLEVGNPNTYQKGLIKSGITGLHNVLIYLKMLKGDIEIIESPPIICTHSYWIYTDFGGLLTVHPSLSAIVEKGQLIASQYDLFGDKIAEYHAPERGVIIGKSVHPVNQTGGRILHLGILEE